MLKRVLFILPLLLFAVTSEAQTLRYCQTLLTSSNRTTDETGAIAEFKPQNYRAVSFIATASNDSGTTPTLDLTVQTCRSTTTSTCMDFVNFSQCTTTPCYTDGVQVADLNRDTVNFFKYFRVVSDLGGTSPQYDYTVEMCHDGQ